MTSNDTIMADADIAVDEMALAEVQRELDRKSKGRQGPIDRKKHGPCAGARGVGSQAREALAQARRAYQGGREAGCFRRRAAPIRRLSDQCRVAAHDWFAHPCTNDNWLSYWRGRLQKRCNFKGRMGRFSMGFFVQGKTDASRMLVTEKEKHHENRSGEGRTAPMAR